jgi:hypothetical protein
MTRLYDVDITGKIPPCFGREQGRARAAGRAGLDSGYGRLLTNWMKVAPRGPRRSIESGNERRRQDRLGFFDRRDLKEEIGEGFSSSKF